MYLNSASSSRSTNEVIFLAAKIIDGDKIAARIFEKTQKLIDVLREKGIRPTLAVVLIGGDPASELYVKKKKQACRALGIEFDLSRFKPSTTEKKVIDFLNSLNYKFFVNGVLVQLPLPKRFNQAKVIDTISPLKDVDGFTAFNLGLLVHGKEGVVSCTAQGILKLIESTRVKIKGSNVCIVNHSIIVGRPLSQLMLNKGATVTICHEFTKDLSKHTREADILVTAVGKPGLIKAEMVKPGAVVIDAGIAKKADKVLGDVDFENVKEVAGFITPVPGGVGPLTVACLTHNLAKLALLQRK
jgi:methylenetetrahydrofolate dehydrogenase (NADP+)/methenyltetrahydrofolate cyclohydrolase